MRKEKGLTFFVSLVYAFLFIPLFIIVVTSFGENPTIQFPIEGFSFKWYANVFENAAFADSFLLSLKIAFFATVLALLVGIPASYALARNNFMGREWLKNFFLSPTIIPGVVVGYSLFQFIVITLQLPVFQGLLLGHFLVSLPFHPRRRRQPGAVGFLHRRSSLDIRQHESRRLFQSNFTEHHIRNIRFIHVSVHQFLQ